MKKVVLAFIVALLAASTSFAGENPKLVKEIQRKIKVDLSGIKWEKSKEHFVTVRFRIVNKEVEVLSVKGSKRELTDLMLKELEEMFITSDADPKEIHHFKFNFSQE
ncbi:MAG: hypothetical protein Crog4KO_12150 [Crocinitomicaceae bacterium]